MTTFSYRIPNSVPISGFIKKPTCGGCDRKLRQMDFFPMYWYLFISKNCRCGKYKIPISHFILELSTAIFCSLIYLIWYDTDFFIQKALLTAITLMSLAIYYDYKQMYEKCLWILFSFGLFYVLYQRNIDIFEKGMTVFIGFYSLFLLNKFIKIETFDFRYALILLSICDKCSFFVLLPLFLISFIVCKFWKNKIFVPNFFNGLLFLIFEMIIRRYIP